jgi:hypothetical protein
MESNCKKKVIKLTLKKYEISLKIQSNLYLLLLKILSLPIIPLNLYNQIYLLGTTDH